MDLVAFLKFHAEQLEWSARGLSKNKKFFGPDPKDAFDEALQLLLIAASDLLQDVVLDLDGRITHLKRNPEFYRAVEPSSKSLAAYICGTAYHDVLNLFTGKQREFEEDISLDLTEATAFVDDETRIVVRDLIDRTIEFGRQKGEARSNVLQDLLANEGLADYTGGTYEKWQQDLRRQPKGRSHDRVPTDFIFKTHGLTVKEGRVFVQKVANFLRENGFNRRAA